MRGYYGYGYGGWPWATVGQDGSAPPVYGYGSSPPAPSRYGSGYGESSPPAPSRYGSGYGESSPPAPTRVPTMAELIAQLQALYAQIQQTDREMAVQSWDDRGVRGVRSERGAKAKFVSQHWRPFVALWDQGMAELYEYQAGRGAPLRSPASVPVMEPLIWYTRMRDQYHQLLARAFGEGLSISMPASLRF